MRVANLLVMGAAAMLVWACAATEFPDNPAPPASVEVSGNDCAVMVAVAKEHYKFGPDNPPPPLKGLGDSDWAPVRLGEIRPRLLGLQLCPPNWRPPPAFEMGRLQAAPLWRKRRHSRN